MINTTGKNKLPCDTYSHFIGETEKHEEAKKNIIVSDEDPAPETEVEDEYIIEPPPEFCQNDTTSNTEENSTKIVNNDAPTEASRFDIKSEMSDGDDHNDGHADGTEDTTVAVTPVGETNDEVTSVNIEEPKTGSKNHHIIFLLSLFLNFFLFSHVTVHQIENTLFWNKIPFSKWGTLPQGDFLPPKFPFSKWGTPLKSTNVQTPLKILGFRKGGPHTDNRTFHKENVFMRKIKTVSKWEVFKKSGSSKLSKQKSK